MAVASGSELMCNNIQSEKSDSIYKSVCHKCPVDNKTGERDKRRIIVVSVVCLIFMVSEIVGGIASNSLAIASDAAHLLTDFGAFMVSLAAIWISSKPQTAVMSFGFHRAEVIGALISVFSIWVITGVLVYMAIQRIIDGKYELHGAIMMYVAAAGIAANLFMGLILVFYKGRSGERTKVSPLREESINVKSALIHVIGDLLQSIGVLIASVIVYFKPKWKIIDPICTFLFSFLVLLTTIKILRDVFLVLMEGFPRHLSFTLVRNVLYSIPGVAKIHNMRMWSLTMDKVALSAHIVIERDRNQSDVLREASKIIHDELDVYEVTLQVEYVDEPLRVCSVCA